MIPLQLHSAPKYGGGSFHRVVPPAETFRRVKPLLAPLGITRLADITGLDRLGITTYSSIVPDTADMLSVYNGKGPTKMHAKVGAIMEAIERYSSLQLDQTLIMGSYAELAPRRPVLNPATLMLKLHDHFTATSEIAWVEGYDLLTQQTMLVPAQAVAITYLPQFGVPCYPYCTTNGVASGNTLEEAVCHGLFELIERDAWTLAELGARYRPHAQRQAAREEQGIALPQEEVEWDDDAEAYPNIDLDMVPPLVRRFANKFRRVGVQLQVKDITSDLGIPTVLASAVEQTGPEIFLAHFGLGTHLDPEIAIIRAITEVAQSRVVDIQGVREDLITADEEANPHARHTKRVSTIRQGSWYYRESQSKRRLQDMPRLAHPDILEDIHFMLNRLRRAGVKHAIAVDLTKPAANVPVVRMLIPGMESWAADHGRLGWRAHRFWHQTASASEGTP